VPRLTKKYLRELREKIDPVAEGELALTREESMQLIRWIEKRMDAPPQVVVRTVSDEGQNRAAAAWKYGPRH